MGKIPLFFQGDSDRDQMLTFLKHYTLQKNFEAVYTDKDVFVAKEERVCRYCGLKGSWTKWDDAHIVPDLLGNHNRMAMDECRECNQKFSKYDTALSNFLGMARTMNSVRGKKKIPSYKSGDQSIVVRPSEFQNRSVVKVSKENDGCEIKMDVANKKVFIKYTKESYIPLNVAKAFTKIGYALLPKEEIAYYTFTKDFLLSDKNDPVNSGSFYLRGFTIPFNSGVPYPIVWIYKKNDPNANIPTHVCILWWQNYFFHFCIPIHSNDRKRMQSERFGNPRLPMMFFHQTNGKIPVVPFVHDLSSNLKIQGGDKETIQIDMQEGMDLSEEGLQRLQDYINQGNFELIVEQMPRTKVDFEHGK